MPVSDRRPVAVPQNHWDSLDVSPLGSLEPRLRVSVIVPYYENQNELELTLVGLGRQTYPAGLIQVIVVDDGSVTQPATLPDGLPYEALVLRQEDLGYGLARARNRGANEASGEILIFLDSDMIPVRTHVEAHARWHHSARRLVTVGFRYHADFTGITAGRVADVVDRDAFDGLFQAEQVARPEWIEAHVARTENLLAPVDDLYLLMSGGNLGVDRALYLEAGGTDETFTRWGGEDNELAYRLIQLGAVVVPERAATAWHQGEGHEPSEDELRALRLQKPKMRALIPDVSTRWPVPGRIYPRPYLLVHVDPADHPAEVVGVTVDSILASDFNDLVVGIGKAADDEDQAWLEANYEGDPRVTVGTIPAQLFESSPFSPARLEVAAGTALSADTLDLALQSLGAASYGLIHVTLPTGSDELLLARLVLTRAQNRAVALGSEGGAVDAEIGRMFGERWVSGASLGMWAVEDPIVDAGRVRMRLRPNLLAATELEVRELSERLDAMQSRRSLLLINGFGTILRARSRGDVKLGLAAIKRALLPRSSADAEGEEKIGGP